jgi:hypothetical protein
VPPLPGIHVCLQVTLIQTGYRGLDNSCGLHRGMWFVLLLFGRGLGAGC